MLIAFGCDHAGFALKREIIEFLNSSGHKVIDCGCFSSQRCDYPDYAIPVANYVSKGKADRGVLICGTGMGMGIIANKVRDIRAAVCYSDETATLASEHNKANILCLGARTSTVDDMKRWIKIWLETQFAGDRHQKRIDKIRHFENKYCKKIY